MLSRIHFFVLSILLVFVCSFLGYAQDVSPRKIVLNNGTKIKGASNISFEKEYLKVNLNAVDEDVLIRYDRIKKICLNRAGKPKGTSLEQLPKPPSLQTNTFFHELRGGLLIGEDHVSATLQTINGYQFNRYLGAGLSIGVNTFEQQITMPVYATVKGYIFDKHISPFYFGDIGYGFAWKKDGFDGQIAPEKVQGGYYWQLGLGYQINFHNNSFVFTFGYMNQDSRTDYVYPSPWDGEPTKVSEQRLHRRFSFAVGFLF